MSIENKSLFKDKAYLFFLFVPVISLITGFLFANKVYGTHFVPDRYLYIFAGVLVILNALHTLVILKKRKVMSWILSVISVLLSVVFVIANIYFSKVTSTIDKISDNASSVTSDVSVVVLKDSGISDVSGLFGKKIGLTDSVAVKAYAMSICNETGEVYSFADYEHVAVLFEALLQGYEDGVIVESEFLDVYSELEGYEDFFEKILVLQNKEVVVSDESTDIVFDRTASLKLSDLLETRDIAEDTAAESGALNETVSEAGEAGQSLSSQDIGNNGNGTGNGKVSSEDTSSSNTSKPVVVNTGGVPSSDSGAHTSRLSWGDDIITAPSGCFIAYVSGIDTVGSVDVKRRSDVNILAVVNTNTGTIQLIDTPRDYFVILPQVNAADKLTHAGIYGTDYSIAALEKLYGVHVDYFLRMNFTGFVKIVDTIGGLDVYSQYEFTVDPVKTYTVGMNHLNGVEALAFARERYSFSSGDLQRGVNQMAVINAMVQKFATPEVIYNFQAILDCVSDSMQTSMPTDVIYSFVNRQIQTGTGWNINSFEVGGFGASSTTYSGPTKVGYVMTPNDNDVAAAHNLIRSVVGY